jgi:hypothetical protein
VLPCIIGRTKLRITHLVAGRSRRPLDGIFVDVICVVSAALAGYQLTLLYECLVIIEGGELSSEDEFGSAPPILRPSDGPQYLGRCGQRFSEVLRPARRCTVDEERFRYLLRLVIVARPVLEPEATGVRTGAAFKVPKPVV